MTSSNSNEYPDIISLPSHPPPVRRLFLDTSVPVYHLGWLVTQQHLLSKYCPSVPVDITRLDMLELIENRVFKAEFRSRNSGSKYAFPHVRPFDLDKENLGPESLYIIVVGSNCAASHIPQVMDSGRIVAAKKSVDTEEDPAWYRSGLLPRYE